jgi:hypothetical protein
MATDLLPRAAPPALLLALRLLLLCLIGQQLPLALGALAVILLLLDLLLVDLRVDDFGLGVFDGADALLHLPSRLDVGFEADEHGVRARYADAAHVHAVVLHVVHEGAEVLGRWAVVA